MKKIYSLAFLLMFLLFPNLISARDPDEVIYGKPFYGVDCYYSLSQGGEYVCTEGELHLHYDGRDNRVDKICTTTDSSYYFVEFLDDINASLFENNGNYVCPEMPINVYKSYYQDYIDQNYQSQGERLYYYFTTTEPSTINNRQVDFAGKWTLKTTKITSKSDSENGNTDMFCSIHYIGDEADYNVRITLNNSNKTITDIDIDRYEEEYVITSSSLTFDDVVVKSGNYYNCKNTVENMTLKCDYNSSENKSYCTIEIDELSTSDPGDGVYGCAVIPDEIREWINSTLNLVKYIALVLVIVLGILDFIKAAASGEADQMKKSGSSFLKRIIAVVILFLLPLIVELVLNLIEIYGADSTCLPN